MTNPGTLLDAIVTQLRATALLVVEMGGDAQRILPYYDEYPKNKDVDRAIAMLPAPGVLVHHPAGGGSSGRMQPWAYEFELILKSGEKQPTDSGAVHYAALHLLRGAGVPAGSSLSLLDMEIHPSVDPMVTPPRWQRRSVTIASGDVINYFSIYWTLTENSA